MRGFGDFEYVDDYGNVIGLNPDGTIPGPDDDAALLTAASTATVAPVSSIDPTSLLMIAVIGLGIYFLMKGAN